MALADGDHGFAMFVAGEYRIDVPFRHLAFAAKTTSRHHSHFAPTMVRGAEDERAAGGVDRRLRWN